MKRLMTAALTSGGSLVCVQVATCENEPGTYTCVCEETGYIYVDGICVEETACFPDPCGVPPHPNPDM